ncbi:MAG: hypothetical protein A2854_02605 [Parcubacteria group bacterium RIFCSPHIGHO2_01_FULL_56_18]|nr:MAG: hypothetical protein A2854_02605 [Parcubacteria group bacterium RIFCSPHIGHO2_01_FULL_56_18]
MLKRLIRGGFEDALAKLLRKANFLGRFKYRALQTVKGTTHTKGLQVKRPQSFGVEVTYHEGSNDNNILVLVHAPTGMNSHEFLAALCNALKIPDGDDLPKQKTNGHGGRVLPALPQKEPEPPAPTPREYFGVEEGKLALTDGAVELLMAELVQHCDEKGIFHFQRLKELLVTICRFEVPDSHRGIIGYTPVIRSMMHRKHILAIENMPYHRRMGLLWRIKFLAESTDESNAEVAPAAAAQEPTTPTSDAGSENERFASLKELAKRTGASEISQGVFAIPAREELVASPAERRLVEVMELVAKKRKLQERYNSINEQRAELWVLKNTIDEQQRTLAELAEASLRMSATVGAFEKRYADNLVKLKITLDRSEYREIEAELDTLKKNTLG